MDMVLVGGIAVGLVMGSFGYVLVRFGLRPVVAYRRLRGRLARLLAAAHKEGTLTEDARNSLRHAALELQDLLDDVLPFWYKLALAKREERPQEAVRHLQALANCRERSAIQQRAAAARQRLGV